MTGAVTAAALLMVVLALALAFVPRRTAFGSAAFAAIALAAGSVASVPAGVAFGGTWCALVVAALSVYWPQTARSRPWLCYAVSAIAGAWAGMLATHQTGAGGALAIIAGLLPGLPAAWCIDRGFAIVPRVVTSWLLAVALLAGVIPYLVEHPGYVADHRN